MVRIVLEYNLNLPGYDSVVRKLTDTAKISSDKRTITIQHNDTTYVAENDGKNGTPSRNWNIEPVIDTSEGERSLNQLFADNAGECRDLLAQGIAKNAIRKEEVLNKLAAYQADGDVTAFKIL